MGRMTKKMADMQARRVAYQEKWKEREMLRVANYLPACDRQKFLEGTGFVVLPEEERLRLRIDSYPYLR